MSVEDGAGRKRKTKQKYPKQTISGLYLPYTEQGLMLFHNNSLTSSIVSHKSYFTKKKKFQGASKFSKDRIIATEFNDPFSNLSRVGSTYLSSEVDFM